MSLNRFLGFRTISQRVYNGTLLLRLRRIEVNYYYRSWNTDTLREPDSLLTGFFVAASPTAGDSDATLRSSGGRVPNTNKHSTKGSNPIWLHAYENDWYKSDDQLSRSERDSLDENAVNQDLSNEKPYFITTAAFPSMESDDAQTNTATYDFYQQLEQMKNAKNMETTEL